MRKTALIALLSASTAALLLVAAAVKSSVLPQPHPYTVAAWLGVVASFGVFAVMLTEHLIHGRQIHLYLSGAFLALGIMGLWDAVTLPYEEVFGGSLSPGRWSFFALWQWQWVTLALALLIGIAVSGKATSRKRQDAGSVTAALAVHFLWASALVFLISIAPRIAQYPVLGSTRLIVNVACAGVFALCGFAYSRNAVHRGNAVLSCMAYGLLFAVLAQAAMLLQDEPSASLFGFAGGMKVLFLLSPLVGMPAEHARIQTRLRAQASDMSSLMQAQQAVATIGTPAELYQRIVELVSDALPTQAVCLMPFEKDRGLLRVAAQVGFDDDIARQLVFRSGEGPAGESFSQKQTVLVHEVADDLALTQKLGGSSGVRSAAFLPMIAQNECLGVLAAFFSRPVQKLSKEEMRLLEALGDQAALAMDGVRLRNRMVNTSRTTDDYARELEIVCEVGQAVASELELHSLVDTLSDRLREALGAMSCRVIVFEADLSGLRIMGHGTMTRHQSVADYVDQCDIIASTVAQNGEPMLMNDIPNSAHCKYPELARDDGGVHHLLAVPMTARGFTGAINVVRQNAEPFADRDRRLLMRLAPMVAAGVRNADLYERERGIAQNLQKSLMPETSEEHPEIQVGRGYQVAYDESLVGGDFHDVIDFGEGRYGIAIGDVSGKGVDASVYTAMARYMIQAYSAEDPDPASVVPRLNTALCRYTPTGKFVTLLYGLLDTRTGTLTYVNAGHEPPLVYYAAVSGLEVLNTTGPAVGALADGQYEAEQIVLQPGDTLILYTDGATEARSEGKFLGTDGLREMVAQNIHREVPDLTRAILEGIRSYSKGRLRDDIALLVVRMRKPGALF